APPGLSLRSMATDHVGEKNEARRSGGQPTSAPRDSKSTPAPESGSLRALLCPRSVAIIGANQRPHGFSAGLSHSVRSLGYPGKLFLLNPKNKEIGGQPCYPDILSLPELPDCALLAVGDEKLVHAIEQV